MNNERDKNNKNNIEENIEKPINAFNDIKLFLYLLLCSELLMLYYSGRQMFFQKVRFAFISAWVMNVVICRMGSCRNTFAEF
ncbi:hypothetical protein [Sedimentibacter sp.]|uniref:hypothetical protein n=1 Tax=Sedimentibacter sp. TaxID=1960295 RepID=UPI0028A7242A|nr:hypothetical protein [Sedimentibacter sp.]